MEKYSVSLVAKIAGISIRTLHHYDKIGLLNPAKRAESRYRYYTKTELFRLQQILFFKELDFPLKKIQRILDDPEFDLIEALSFQRIELKKRKSRLDDLLKTIDKTVKQLSEEKEMVTESELYDGFSKEEIDAWKKEVDEKYDKNVVSESNENIRKMSKGDFAAIKEEQEAVAKELAELMYLPVENVKVQAIILRHHTTNEKFYKTSAEMYKGLADMYVSDPRFTQFYDKHHVGLSKFLREAMHYFADDRLK